MHIPLTANLTLLAILIIASITDVRERRVPNLLSAAGAVAGGAALIAQGDVWHAAHGLAVAFSIVVAMLAIRWACSRLMGEPGIGMGDVKLLAVIALFTGWASFSIFYLACVAGAVFGVGRRMILRGEETRRIAFVPFVLVGFLAEWWLSPVGRVFDSLLIGY